MHSQNQDRADHELAGVQLARADRVAGGAGVSDPFGVSRPSRPAVAPSASSKGGGEGRGAGKPDPVASVADAAEGGG